MSCCTDEAAVSAARKSISSEGVEQKGADVVPLATMSELGTGQSSSRHHLPAFTVP